ncbi:MAG: hypothetical protein LAO05_01805 [Acidobacteriia bacterium]|nr:hypothetical protein [Terriglobia bacterium]
MRGRVSNKQVTVGLLVVLTPWCVGCASGVYVKRNTGAGGDSDGGALEVRVFENWSDLHRDVVSNRKVLTELYRDVSRSQELIREDPVSRWSASDLAPGRYVVRVRWSAKPPNMGAPSRVQEKPLVIRSGQTTVVDVVVKDARKSWARAAIGGAVVIGAASYIGYRALQSWEPLAGLSFH